MGCNDVTLGQRIRNARIAAGLTQRDLGNELGVSYQTIAYWERDTKKPTASHLKQLAFLLDIDSTEHSHLNEFSSNLRFWRKHKGLTQVDLSVLTGISLRKVKEYESLNFELCVSRKDLATFSALLHVDANILLGKSLDLETYQKTVREECRSRMLDILDTLSIDGMVEAVNRVREMSEQPKWHK